MLQQKSYKINPLTSIIILLLVGLFLYLMFKGLYQFAYWALPVLVIATLIIDYKVYINHGKKTINRFREEFLWGLVRLVLDITFFPLLILWLFGKAVVKKLISRKLKNHPVFQESAKEGEFIPYEEVEVNKGQAQSAEVLELPSATEKPKAKNTFDDYFN